MKLVKPVLCWQFVKRKWGSGWKKLLTSFALLSAMLLCAFQPNWLQMGRNSLFDQYQRWQPREYWSLPVRIIDIDEESIKRVGQWPWPRSVMAQLLNKLSARQPLVIAVDVVFAEPDRTSPQAMFDLWSLNDVQRHLLGYLPDHDQLFADAIKQNPVVLGFEGLAQNTKTSGIPLLHSQYVQQGPAADGFLYGFAGALKSLALFEKNASGGGALNFVADGDGVVRRVPLLLNVNGQVLPSLAPEAVRVIQKVDHYITRCVADGLQSLQIGRYAVPTTEKSEMWLHYTPVMRERYIPAWQVLADQVAPELLASTVLIIGASALSLGDTHLSTLGESIPGSEVHAQAIEQLLTGQILQRPSWAVPLELLLVLVGGLLIAQVAQQRSITAAAGLGVGLVLLVNALCWLAFSRYELLIDPVAPSIGWLWVFLLLSNALFIANERYQRWIRQAFSRYVSPNLVEFLVRNPDQLALGGHRRECSFVFTDLQGFTGFMEHVSPEQAFAILNVYIDRIVSIAFKHQGTLDRIVGDAVAIMFSAPVTQLDHPQRAMQCALEIHSFAQQYAAELMRDGVSFGQTYIGVHCGEVIVGNLGGGSIIDYRALGDVVNTTSRLQSACHRLGSQICVSEAIAEHCPELAMRPIGRVLLKGKTHELMVYQPLLSGGHDDVRYSEAYGLMVSGDPKALDSFTRLAAQRPEDALVALHLARLQAGETGDLLVFTGK